jgi:glycosyltransferase involved in cell wall biosynthesis
MEKSPFISVLIPTYNRAHYIREAIEVVFIATAMMHHS